MNLLDLLIAVAIVAAATGGYRLGFLARAVSWFLMLVGLVVVARILPTVIRGTMSADQPNGRPDQILLAAGLLVAGAFLGQAIGLWLASRLDVAVLKGPRAQRIDAVAGAFAGALGVLLLVWLLIPAMADVPGTPARLVRDSAIARAVDSVFPPSPDPSRALRQLMGPGTPEVFDALRPAPTLGPPPAESGLDDATAARVARSVVKVVGQACDQIQEGSGFVVAGNLVVTNAHVVAGERTTRLERDDGSRVTGTVVAFDPSRDLAVLSVPSIDRPALPLGDAAIGDRGGSFGHPGGGPLEISPYVVADRVTATGTDIYGAAPVRREVLFLSARLAPGDSGSALVEPGGTVVGVAFAIAPDDPDVAYALTTDELRAVLDAGTDSGAVDTGGCLAA